ncbi:hypothetical protein L917_14796 [Phytophthora nicotianae]|uniref:Uncharacterized protein n=1 Tax=Phytophthora nicotianae TaxID=4792 RepID=W2KKL3_PHYNI|nr:hypothetical protein L917_14796 [Phytophthora nicotianae]
MRKVYTGSKILPLQTELIMHVNPSHERLILPQYLGYATFASSPDYFRRITRSCATLPAAHSRDRGQRLRVLPSFSQ